VPAASILEVHVIAVGCRVLVIAILMVLLSLKLRLRVVPAKVIVVGTENMLPLGVAMIC
jgi:hypothetical protein